MAFEKTLGFASGFLNHSQRSSWWVSNYNFSNAGKQLQAGFHRKLTG